MGVIRGGLLSLVCVLLFISLLLGNVFMVFTYSLSYNNLETSITPLVRDLVTERIDVNQSFAYAQTFCNDLNNTNFSVEIEELNESLNFPCEEIPSDANSFLDSGAKDILQKVYYAKYSCGFWSCIAKGQPFVLISEKARDYWRTNYYYALVASLILVVLVFLLVEHKYNFFLVVGGILILSSFILKKLNSVLAFIVPSSFEEFSYSLVSKSSSVFTGVLIIGIILVVLGILLKFLLSDFIKKKFSRKDVEEMVKKGIEDSKKKILEKEKPKKAKKK